MRLDDERLARQLADEEEAEYQVALKSVKSRQVSKRVNHSDHILILSL